MRHVDHACQSRIIIIDLKLEVYKYHGLQGVEKYLHACFIQSNDDWYLLLPNSL